MKNYWWAVIVAAALLIAGYFYWQKNQAVKVETTEEAIEILTENPVLSGAADVPSNPLENKVPALNPVEKINPFKEVYRNPFE